MRRFSGLCAALWAALLGVPSLAAAQGQARPNLVLLHPVAVEVHHAEPGGLEAFRKAASAHLAARNHVVVVNYLRAALRQEHGGHISPLTAYDAQSDRFLILDVARYKYPPVWVTASDLFDAMNTADADNGNKTRGYVLVANTAGAANH